MSFYVVVSVPCLCFCVILILPFLVDDPLKQKGLGSILLRLSVLFKKVVVCGHSVVSLSFTINETLKWPSSLPILMQRSLTIPVIPVMTVLRQVYNLPLPPPLHHLSPFFSSGITVSVDVKHDVYFHLHTPFPPSPACP